MVVVEDVGWLGEASKRNPVKKTLKIEIDDDEDVLILLQGIQSSLLLSESLTSLHFSAERGGGRKQVTGKACFGAPFAALKLC